MTVPCPEMVVVPAGTFLIGSPDQEPGRLPVEGPRQWVAFARPFAVGRYPVTVDQYEAFVAASGYPAGAACQLWTGADWEERPGSFRAPGFEQTDRHPAVCVSHDDATAFVRWLSRSSGRCFRLPTEAEWEYAARAGTNTPYWWGDTVAPDQANAAFGADSSGAGSGTVEVDRFRPNPWGLHQVHGNIWEWVEDCYHDSHSGIPADGSARSNAASAKRVVRGGGWRNRPQGLRSARRHAARPDYRRSDIGFRIAETLAGRLEAAS